MVSRRLTCVDEDAKFKENHHLLLQQYLILQKILEAKAKVPIEYAIAEFRQTTRYYYSTAKTRCDYEAGPSGRHANASEAVFRYSLPTTTNTMGRLWNSGNIVTEKVGFEPLRIGKKKTTPKPKKIKEEVTFKQNLFPNGKQRAEKRKITWEDQLALKVY